MFHWKNLVDSPWSRRSLQEQTSKKDRGGGREGVGLADNCQILAVRSDNCQIGQLSDRRTVRSDNCQCGQLSDRTTVSADNCRIRQLSVRTTVSGDNCQWGQLSVGQLSVDHGQLSEETVSALKKL